MKYIEWFVKFLVVWFLLGVITEPLRSASRTYQRNQVVPTVQPAPYPTVVPTILPTPTPTGEPK